MDYIFGLGREGCVDCAQIEGAAPLCTMNCSSRIGEDGVTCPACGFPAIECNNLKIRRLQKANRLMKAGVQRRVAIATAETTIPANGRCGA